MVPDDIFKRYAHHYYTVLMLKKSLMEVRGEYYDGWRERCLASVETLEKKVDDEVMKLERVRVRASQPCWLSKLFTRLISLNGESNET